MPRLLQTTTTTATRIQFIASPTLDMLNAMYFTSLVPQMEGIEGWPAQLRVEMAPDLLAELDFLYNYPAGDPGIMGTFGDNLFTHPETWRSIDALLAYVHALPDGIGDGPASPGIQGLIYETTFRFLDAPDCEPYAGLPQREAIERRLRSLDDRDADAIMPLWDRPGELRERMAKLIERFYHEHYRRVLPERMRALEAAAAAHRGDTAADPAELAGRLTHRQQSCLERTCGLDYERFIFAPSMDLGPYTSCTGVGGVHGLFYPMEAEFLPGGSVEDEEEVRLARLFKALSDEQRLRILRLLRAREMYANEIVEATGLHQSVVSRHLGFMKAVGLLNARKHNNMKFFSINPAVHEDLGKALDLLIPAISQNRE